MNVHTLLKSEGFLNLHSVLFSAATYIALPGLYNFVYVERLKICKLEYLELRRIKCDVI